MSVRFNSSRYAYIGSFKTDKAPSGGPTVYLRQVKEGCWVVNDEDFIRGGTFRDEQSALRFIRWDIDINALVIVVRQLKNAASDNQPQRLINGRGKWEQR